MTLELGDWEVWHCYSSYVVNDLPDLSEVGRRIVESGVVELAALNGDTHWFRRGGNVQRVEIEVTREGSAPRGTFKMPTGLDSYQMECALEAVWLDTQERFLASRSARPSLRGFMQRCRLEFGTWAVELYPHVKFYEDGIILLTLRVRSGQGTYECAEFVREQVNLFLHDATAVWLPPRVFRAYAMARVPERLSEIWRVSSYLKRLEDWLRENSRVDDQTDFPVELVQIVGNYDLAADHGGKTYTLRVLASILEHAVHGAIRGKSSVWGTVRAKRSSVQWGGSWAGRPSIYLISFDHQSSDSKSSVQRFKQDLAGVMLRTKPPPVLETESVLGEDLRLFSDYSLFVSRELSLWVFGSKHAGSSSRGENWASILYDKQVQAELIDYRYAAHRRLEERSRNLRLSLRQVLDEDERVADVERLVESSDFGELNRLVQSADDALGLDRIRKRTQENLRRRAMIAEDARERSARRFEWLLTILIAVIGLPSLAEFLKPSVDQPLQRLGVSPKAEGLWIWLGTAVVLIVLVVVLRRVTTRAAHTRF